MYERENVLNEEYLYIEQNNLENIQTASLQPNGLVIVRHY